MAINHRELVPEGELPDEAEDETVTEMHDRAVTLVCGALRLSVPDGVVVLREIFVRDVHSDGARQVAPDVVVAAGGPGLRRTFRLPDESPPRATVEVLSWANYSGAGRDALARKRRLLGDIGVPFHLEVDPERGYLVEWRHDGGDLAVSAPSDRYDGEELFGVRIEVEPGSIRVWRGDGREYLGEADEARRADAEARRADAEARRAGRLAEALRRAGIDPEGV